MTSTQNRMRAIQRSLPAKATTCLYRRCAFRAVPSRPFASVAPDIGLWPPRTAPATSTFQNLWNGLLSAVAQPDDPATVYRKKYAEKLKRVAESEGAATVDELLQKRKSPPTPPPSPSQPPTKKSKPTTAAPAKRKGDLPPHVKTLDQIVNIEKLAQEDGKVIGDIWNKFHAARKCLSGSMTGGFYEKLMKRGREFPLFILPLPRNQGYEFFMLQFSGHQVFFTPLLEYKTHRENARPHLILTHYTDLSPTKDVVLMVGELGDPDRTVLTLPEAQNLVYQMQMYYVTGGEEVRGLVERFHREPEGFDYQRLIAALESLGSA
ncbi:ATP11 protein-domain-containing protein [Fimicolochytrium jonesii]|uniref:ATP11 protein-domain-containing protein n=1 Tax=Fimicolochytrium jonesii TaxID=1396493 RepID=UPI0022FEB8B5|nr:ATP11 protein-domain-containing protein [Fimicolochytrium jonesii]KAI8815578.1 ATP11 protein-domain-containing protein [Fimicolochytrium jonesii]